jgi:hypothetical protein
MRFQIQVFTMQIGSPQKEQFPVAMVRKSREQMQTNQADLQ